MHQFWTRKECKGSLFLQAVNICNSLKNISRYFSNFSWKMMFISLVVFTVPLQQTMKWKGMAKNANNERGWQKIQTIKKDGEKWKGWRPMQIIWDKRGSQVKMVGLTVLSLAECKFCKTAPKNENWPRGAWTLATSCILQVKPIYIRPHCFCYESSFSLNSTHYHDKKWCVIEDVTTLHASCVWCFRNYNWVNLVCPKIEGAYFLAISERKFDLITVWPCWPLEWHRRDCITSGCLKNFF